MSSINEEEAWWVDEMFAVVDAKLEPVLPEGWGLRTILFLVAFGWVSKVGHRSFTFCITRLCRFRPSLTG